MKKQKVVKEISHKNKEPGLSFKDQEITEKICAKLLSTYKNDPIFRNNLALYRKAHTTFLLKGLNMLPEGYTSLDASRPWICYWILHSLDLLDEKPEHDSIKIVNWLNKCQLSTGGFGGGPGQLAHLAPSYASINTIMILGIPEAYKLVNREKMYTWLLSLKQPNGGFIMHHGGEIDVRCDKLKIYFTLEELIVRSLSLEF